LPWASNHASRQAGQGALTCAAVLAPACPSAGGKRSFRPCGMRNCIPSDAADPSGLAVSAFLPYTCDRPGRRERMVVMFRILLAMHVAAWAILGPALCCCAAVGAFSAPPPASDLSLDPAEAACCGCQQASEPPGSPIAPTDPHAPRCPCKQAPPPAAVLAGVSFAPVAPGITTGFSFLTAAVQPLSSSRSCLVLGGGIAVEPVASPFGFGGEMLRALHILRC